MLCWLFPFWCIVLWVLTHVTTTTARVQNSPTTQNIPSLPPCTPSRQHPTPQSTPLFCHINGITCYTTFETGFFHSLRYWWDSPGPWCVPTARCFLLPRSFLLYDAPQCTYPFTHSGTFGLFLAWGVINRAARNTGIHISVWHKFSFP